MAGKENSRLSRTFHQTFIPEKIYLGALLKYAANQGIYDAQEIAAETGIPTGASSGKAIPTADYCRGMRLVEVFKDGSALRLKLSPLGRTILLEDRFFRESLTQWVAHLNLCQKDGGAETWYQIFWNNSQIFGERFSREMMDSRLASTLGTKEAKNWNPTINMYADPVSFQQCGAIREEKKELFRKKAPLNPSFVFGYAAWLAEGIEQNQATGYQVAIHELEQFCGFRSITCWNSNESQQVLEMMERKGLIVVDRHMTPWIVTMKYRSIDLWKRLYEDFI